MIQTGTGRREGDEVSEDWPAWPTFIGAFGESEDRRGETGGIFAQMREEKNARVSAGTVLVDRHLGQATQKADASRVANGEHDEVAAFSTTRNSDDDDAARDLTNLHEQLRRGEVSAADVAALLESMTADGEASPLALRVLGEAYLELGRTDQAALLLRQAMTTRSG